MKKQRKTSWLVRLTGLSPDILQHCSESFQLRVAGIGAKLLFTASVSAAIMTFALVAVVIRVWWTLFLVFPLFFGINFFLDRLVITGLKSRLLILIRLLAVLVIPILNVTLVDVMIFERDLKVFFQNGQTEQIANLRGASQTQKNIHQRRITVAKEKMASLADSIAYYDHLLNAEVDGTGGSKRLGDGEVSAFKQRTLGQTKLLRMAQIEKLEQDIGKETEQIKKIDQAFNEKVSTLSTWHHIGLLGRIELLHDLIFVEKRLFVILFSICWYVFFFLLESLPLFGRMLSDFSEYDQCQEAQSQALITQFVQRTKNQMDLYLHEITLEYQKALYKQQRATSLTNTQAVLDEILEMFHYEMNTIITLANEEERIDQDLEEKYRDLTKAVFQRARSRMKAYMKDPGQAA